MKNNKTNKTMSNLLIVVNLLLFIATTMMVIAMMNIATPHPLHEGYYELPTTTPWIWIVLGLIGLSLPNLFISKRIIHASAVVGVTIGWVPLILSNNICWIEIIIILLVIFSALVLDIIEIKNKK